MAKETDKDSNNLPCKTCDKCPDEETGEKVGVVVGGREFEDFEKAANKWAKSYTDEQAELTRLQQENALLRKKEEDWNEEKERLEVKEQEEKPEATSEWLDWDNAPKAIDARMDAKIKALKEELTKKEKERTQVTYEERITEANREIALAQADIPELKDEKLLDRIAQEFQKVPPAYMADKLMARYPGALKEAGNNRPKLGYYYVCLLDGTLDEVLGTSKTGKKAFTEGGSKGSTPKSEMSYAEFSKLSPEKQNELLRKEMMATRLSYEK